MLTLKIAKAKIDLLQSVQVSQLGRNDAWRRRLGEQEERDREIKSIIYASHASIKRQQFDRKRRHKMETTVNLKSKQATVVVLSMKGKKLLPNRDI